MAKRLAKLKKELYNAARRCLNTDAQRVKEYVKAKRDYVTDEMFAARYDKLTAQELQTCIDELDMQSGTIQPRKIVASGKQIKLLRALGTVFGIEYHDWTKEELFDPEASTVLAGETLKRRIARSWIDKNRLIPKQILQSLYYNTINPKLQNMLKEGNYKKFIKNPHKLYYESLSPQEANYLIRRLKQMAANIQENWENQHGRYHFSSN